MTMTKLSLFVHILFTADIALLLTGVLLVRNVWRPISETLSGMTGISIPWMHVIFLLTVFFLLVGLYFLAGDIGHIAAGTPIAAGRLATAGLIAVLILANAAIIPIILRVGIMGYVPFVTRMCKVVLRPEKDYVLPDLLRCSDGTQVADQKAWMDKRRPEIRTLFEKEVYGRVPDAELVLDSALVSVEKNALNGLALRKEVVLQFESGERQLNLNVLMYIPADREGPAPAFVGLNFYGNHTIHADPGITVGREPVDTERPFSDLPDRTITEKRGSRATHWPVDRILKRGYALITLYYYDVDPDFDDGFQNGVHPLFYRPGQRHPAPDEWGSIAAWAWGLSRIMDYLETDGDVDHTRVAVMGHSRLGKAALWAGARDERFAMVVSNNSGCMGAALSRRKYGETIADITAMFPHWFCGNFTQYAGREDELPVDQHMLIALVAPRPVYIASAELDLWADPEGEFLAALAASDVYRLLGEDGLAVDAQPPLHEPVMNTVGYHVRSGIHWVTDYDWKRFLDFADMHLKGE
jgi:hypothetical protein